MISDAMGHLGQSSKPSMIFLHGGHDSEEEHSMVMEDMQMDDHASDENVDECFEHHMDESFEEALKQCQEEICGNDEHCFEEVEELAAHHDS